MDGLIFKLPIFWMNSKEKSHVKFAIWMGHGQKLCEKLALIMMIFKIETYIACAQLILSNCFKEVPTSGLPKKFQVSCSRIMLWIL